LSLRVKIEGEISRAMTKYYREMLGKGPEETKVYIIEDMVLVRFRGILTRKEQQLVRTQRGCELVKEMRQVLRDSNIDEEERIITDCTGFSVISSYCDLSTKTGEMVIIFIMDQNIGRIFSGKSCGKEMVVSRHPV
jgi:uncharacterized protein YbcI